MVVVAAGAGCKVCFSSSVYVCATQQRSDRGEGVPSEGTLSPSPCARGVGGQKEGKENPARHWQLHSKCSGVRHAWDASMGLGADVRSGVSEEWRQDGATEAGGRWRWHQRQGGGGRRGGGLCLTVQREEARAAVLRTTSREVGAIRPRRVRGGRGIRCQEGRSVVQYGGGVSRRHESNFPPQTSPPRRPHPAPPPRPKLRPKSQNELPPRQ
jgi:hypothetical protein